MAKDDFPVTVPSLTPEEVVAYLYELQSRGFRVEQNPWAAYRCYSVLDGNGTRKTIVQRGDGGAWHFASTPGGRVSVDAIWSAEDMRSRMGFEPDVRPTSIRTTRGEPASNIAQIARLITGQQVHAVFDPYLD